jgi:hypothetical protein
MALPACGPSDQSLPTSPCIIRAGSLDVLARAGPATAVVYFASPPTSADWELVASLAGEVIGALKGTTALAVRIPMEALEELANHPRVAGVYAAFESGGWVVTMVVTFVSDPTDEDRRFVASLRAEVVYRFEATPAAGLRPGRDVAACPSGPERELALVDAGMPNEIAGC